MIIAKQPSIADRTEAEGWPLSSEIPGVRSDPCDRAIVRARYGGGRSLDARIVIALVLALAISLGCLSV
jgi:hypothetical protein